MPKAYASFSKKRTETTETSNHSYDRTYQMRLNEEDEVVISNHVYNYFKHFGYIYEYNNLSDKISELIPKTCT